MFPELAELWPHYLFVLALYMINASQKQKSATLLYNKFVVTIVMYGKHTISNTLQRQYNYIVWHLYQHYCATGRLETMNNMYLHAF